MPGKKGGLVKRVEPGSLAEYIGIEPFDRIVSLSGVKLSDELDFRFYASQEKVLMEVLKRDGRLETFELDKDPDDLMGIEFKDVLFDGVRVCGNNCSFCFLKQLPKGLRPGLYVRDDDFRLSFLFGNFITLTNLRKEDYARIKEQRLTPLRVSVHTTDAELRERLMGTEKARHIMEDLQWLTSSGIDVHVQIVLLRGINDGHILEKSLNDLLSLGEKVVSVGVVPAIYTKYMKCPPSEPPDGRWAQEVLDLLEPFGEKCRKEKGNEWVYPADEFYYLAEKSVPSSLFYDGFPQYQNGIGMIADFRKELSEIVKGPKPFPTPSANSAEGIILLLTGKMAYKELSACVSDLRLSNRVSVLPIKNSFFGESVTCSGLLTGQDILAEVLKHMRENYPVKKVIVPRTCVSDEGRFLDGFTVQSLSEALKIPVIPIDPAPTALLEAFLG